jgi:hypothetical protein
LEICESSPQNKITGFNQFFEGQFRQFVKKNKFKIEFFFGGPKFPILRKRNRKKPYFIFETAENRLQKEP